VPLLFVGAGLSPRKDETPVTLMDVGPTVLDLFGVPSPATYMGQSLAPLLRGETIRLTRPIAGETRMKQTLLLPDGTKLIRDARHGTHEAYDLRKDSEEKRNLMDRDTPEVTSKMKLLDAFFEGITLKKAGYRVPYRF